MVIKCISRCFVLLVMLGIVFMRPVSASGWNDYVFDLPSGYQVMRANAHDIHLWRYALETGHSALTAKPGVGPLFEIAFDDRYIFAKNRGYGEKDDVAGPVFWTIIDHLQHQVYGPFSEDEFQEAASELGIDHPIEWQTLEAAYRQALRDGRADPAQVDAAFAGTMIFLGILWIFINPMFIAIAACIAVLVRRFRGGTFLKPFFWIWLLLTVVPFASIGLFAVCKWGMYRFY